MAVGASSDRTGMAATATRHGRELCKHGFSFEQVVRDYGDLCQVVTQLASEEGVPIQVDEFRTLNRCLDNATAEAVAEFARQHDVTATDQGIQAVDERLHVFAEEMRRHIQTATLAVSAIKAGTVGLQGVTGAILDMSLISMRDLINHPLAALPLTAGLPPQHRLIDLAAFIAEVVLATSSEAQTRGCKLVVANIEKGLAVDADYDMLFSALATLLENAFKSTPDRGAVSLKVHAAGKRVLIEVGDKCGGLPVGTAEKMFPPSTQGGADSSGLKLGVSFCQHNIEANHGVLSVRDVPGTGCVFTIALPRHTLT
jgi:signal transduction histidine kinase